MTRFEYVVVVFAILLGLGLAQLVGGIGRLLKERQRIKIYWVPLAWVFVLVIGYLFYWNFIWGGRDIVQWDANAVLICFVPLLLMYLQTVLILPDFSAPGDIDMRRHYFGVQQWFFGIFAATSFLVVLILQLYVPGTTWFDASNFIAYSFSTVCIVSALIRSGRFHAVLAAVLAILLLGYLVAGFVVDRV